MGCDHTQDLCETWNAARHIRCTELSGTAAPRNRIFDEAKGEYVICLDCHVLVVANAIERLIAYYDANPGCNDLIQGPLVNDCLTTIQTHFDPVWQDHMYGVWGTDPRGFDEDGDLFDIPMHGLGLFSCRKDAWLRFSDKFRGFGGEEGYIHEKFRQAGRRCLCAPWLRWVHRFGRPFGVPYPMNIADRIRNYLYGFLELGLDIQPISDHFTTFISSSSYNTILTEVMRNQNAIPGQPK